MANSVEATTKGWMPGADKVPVPAENFKVGNQGRRAVCVHIMEGHMAGTKEYFQDPARQISAHIGISETGDIVQYVSFLDSAYANGASWDAKQRCWIDPQGHALKPPKAPTWKLIHAPVNPNLETISIELEGFHTTPRPAVQLAAAVRVLRYILATFPINLAAYRVGETLIGHHDISTIVKANCPGPFVDLGQLASAANIPPPPSPLPVVQRYRVVGLPIFQQQNLLGPTAGFLAPGDVVEVDVLYENDVGHLKDSRGFVDMKGMQVA